MTDTAITELNTEEFLRCVGEMIDKKENIRSMLEKSATDNKIPCPLARKIAKELNVPYEDVGKSADELNIKITGCELGCF